MAVLMIVVGVIFMFSGIFEVDWVGTLIGLMMVLVGASALFGSGIY